MNELDNSGNHDLDFEAIVGQMTDIPATDGNKVNEAPEEETEEAQVKATNEDSETQEPEEQVEDDIDSILDEINGEKVEAGDDQEKSEETEESDEEPDEGDAVLTYKYNDEEFTLTAKEVNEIQKNAGLSKKLTQEAQQQAETRKNLDAEAQAVAFAKQKPEVRELSRHIADAELAIQRGFVFDENGHQVRLDKDDIEATEERIKEAREKLGEMTAPPRLDDLRELEPDFFSQDQEVVAKVAKPYNDLLEEFGYSTVELQSYNDPRDILMIRELLELRELRTRVENAKARRSNKKPAIASKTTKAATGKPSKSQPEAERPKPKQDLLDKISQGSADPGDVADLFMDV